MSRVQSWFSVADVCKIATYVVCGQEDWACRWVEVVLGSGMSGGQLVGLSGVGGDGG